MAKSKKRFKIIDKGNHVIKKDLMTSTVYSYPKEEDSNEKWAVEPYDPKAYLTAYNFDPVIKESLNCLNELHRTKTLCDYEEEIFAFDITDTQTGVNQAMDIQIWFDESEPEQIYCEIVSAFIEEDYWCRGDDYQSLWTVHKDYVQEFLDYSKIKSDAISDNNKPSQEDSNGKK